MNMAELPMEIEGGSSPHLLKPIRTEATMPAKKKAKKKADVFARMTVDQRRQYSERKAAQEQERTRRREELLAGFLKLKYEDEQKKASMNEAKLNVKWREILRQVKSDSLISQLKNLHLWIKETANSQDNIIDLLLRSLAEACQQRTLASQKHLSFTQNMAALHEEYVSLVTHEYRRQEIDLIVKSAEGIERATRQHLHQIKRLQLADAVAAESTEQGEKCELTRFKDAVADVKAKLEEEAALATNQLETQLEEAWFQLASTAKMCEEQTHDLRGECSMLQDKVDANLKTKHKVDKEVLEMQAEISMWKSRFGEKHMESLDKNSELVDQGLDLLRNSLQSQRVQARESIKRSNRISHFAFEELNETNRLGEEILHLADLCRRQETSEDKNLPFIPPLPLPQIISSIRHSEEETVQVTESKRTNAALDTHVYSKGSSIFPESADSGVGSSYKTASLQPDMTLSHPRNALRSLPEEDSTSGDLKDQDSTYGEMDPVVETKEPAIALSSVTLDRIHTLLQDESALKDIAESFGKTQTRKSEYVLKETELMMRTHESLSHFWCKLNNVEVQRLSLMKEAEDLRQENVVLRGTLKNFFYSQGLTNKSLTIPRSPMMVAALSVIKRPTEEPKDPNQEEESPQNAPKLKSLKQGRNPPFVKPIIDGREVVRISQMHGRKLP